MRTNKYKKIQQNLYENYSKYKIMHELYKAKKQYYSSGKCDLTDQEYDNLESSFKAIHGDEEFSRLYCVGYDKDKHLELKKNLYKTDIVLQKVSEKIGYKFDKSEIERKEKLLNSVLKG